MDLKIYMCRVCGNILATVNDSGMKPNCCSKTMELLIPQKDEMLQEKHIPVCELDGNYLTVKIGSIKHPSEEKHYIMWIAMETNYGFDIHYLKPGDDPQTGFLLLPDEKVKKVYAYCNIHDLWVSEKITDKSSDKTQDKIMNPASDKTEGTAMNASTEKTVGTTMNMASDKIGGTTMNMASDKNCGKATNMVSGKACDTTKNMASGRAGDATMNVTSGKAYDTTQNMASGKVGDTTMNMASGRISD